MWIMSFDFFIMCDKRLYVKLVIIIFLIMILVKLSNGFFFKYAKFDGLCFVSNLFI
jgi:hypothetical protein